MTIPKTSSRAITSPAGTADAMEVLARVDLDADDVRRLRRAYEFLRTLETTVRIDSDSGRGWISSDPRDLDSLAARMDDGLPTEEAFLERYLATTTDVREIFDTGMTRLTRAE